MNNASATVITPARLLRQFILAADRIYYATPVAVELLYSEVSTRFVFVHDPKTGRTFPVNPSNIRAAQ